MESVAQLCETLRDVGVMGTGGFEAYAALGGPGDAELQECQRAAEKSGVAGTPHYRFADGAGKQFGLFGREHLALIRLKMHGAGLARRADVRPDFSHAWQAPSERASSL